MTIFPILQVFHALLCPSGHGRYSKGWAGSSFIRVMHQPSILLEPVPTLVQMSDF